MPQALGDGVREAAERGGAPRRLERAAGTDRRLISRSSLTLGSRGFAKFAQVLFLIVAARLLSVEEFATYSYVLVLAAAFTILSDTGVPLVVQRDIAAGRRPPRDLFWSGMPVVVVSALAAAFVLNVVGAVDAGPGSSTGLLLLAGVFVVGNRLFDFAASSLRALGRFGFEAALQVGGAIAFIGGATAATAAGWGVASVLAVLCVKEALSFVVAYAVLRPDVAGSAATRGGVEWKPLVNAGLRLWLAGTALALVTRLPLGVLGNTGSAEEVASFSAAQRFGDAWILLAMSAGWALLPGISYLAVDQGARARDLVRKVLIVASLGSAALAAAVLPAAQPVMRLVFGSSFEGGADALAIVLVGLPAYALLGICWHALIAFDGERKLVPLGLVGLAVSPTLCLILVPWAGDEGAAWSYTLSLAAMAATGLLATVRRLVSGDSRARLEPGGPVLPEAPPGP